jgi:regulator of sigma E protease
MFARGALLSVSDGLQNGLYIIPILAFLILMHELGHFVTARMCGVKVEEFGLGIPPRLWGFTRKGVLWSINAIPFGGFVRVKGEDGKNMDPDSMNAQPPIERAFFLSAGSAMNILVAIVLMILVVGVQGVPHSRTYIAAVNPGSPAAKAGWQAGDRIARIDGHKVEDTEEIVNATHSHAGEPVTVTIERRGKFIDTTVTPRKNPPKGEGAVGVQLNNRTEGTLSVEEVAPGSAAAQAGLQPGDRIVTVNDRPVTDAFVAQTELERYAGMSAPVTIERNGEIFSTEIAVTEPDTGQDIFSAIGLSTLRFKPVYEDVPAINVIPRGFQESYRMTKQMLTGIRELFRSPDQLSNVAGPIGMGQLTSEIIEESTLPVWIVLAQITMVLSLNLAILNLLPLPALDGGRLFFVVIEVLRGGRKIAPEKEGIVHFAGLVLLLGLMFVIAFSDVNRIFDGRSFIP